MNNLLFISKIALLLSFLFLNKSSVAQTCSPLNTEYMNNWYFGGNAGIRFNNNNTVSSLTNGQINQREGCASISDNQGNLLFYTDGQTVYNRNHVIMSNGANLLGHPSSTQSAIIIPRPGSNSQYYIFTCGFMLANGGIHFSLVDMNLQSGMGGIIPNQKNILLYSNPGGTVEKLAATFHQNNSDIWVIYHEFNNNAYQACLVTSSRIEPPITSLIGVNIGSNWDAVGYMKFSPNSNLLATSLGGVSQRVQLFNFDNSTGLLSNRRNITMPVNYSFCYGIEFSPNENYIYVSTLNNSALASQGAIIQYDLTLITSLAITASRTFITTSNSINYGALQLGPDGIIYSAKENSVGNGNAFLGTIEAPNELGALSIYTEESIDLNTRTTLIGLPTFLNPISGCTLPVNLLTFEVSYDCFFSANKIKWTIENITETKEITIEKSNNGYTFDSLTSIAFAKNTFEYNDYINNSNINYYRLKMTDINGVCTYSNIINSNWEQTTHPTYYPNPFTDMLNISFSENKSHQSSISIYNLTGLLIYSEDIVLLDKKHTIDTNKWPSGIYHMKITTVESSFSDLIIKK